MSAAIPKPTRQPLCQRQPSYSTEYFVPPQDPILGIKSKHIAPAITLNNWRHKAIQTRFENQPLYIYIAQGEVAKLNRKVFCATSYCTISNTVAWRHPFLTPEEAVSWINRHFG